MITRKEFNKILENTILDFEEIQHYEYSKKLKFILNKKDFKDLTVGQVSPLVELILEDDFLKLPEIQEEHKIMKNYLSYYFDFGKYPGMNLIYLSKKDKNDTKY